MAEGDPVSWFVVEKGWKVVGADGADVGTVDEVLGDSGTGIFNGLSVSTGLLSRPRYVPAERVAEITEGCIRLDLPAGAVGSLDEHEPPPPSAQIRADTEDIRPG